MARRPRSIRIRDVLVKDNLSTNEFIKIYFSLNIMTSIWYHDTIENHIDLERKYYQRDGMKPEGLWLTRIIEGSSLSEWEKWCNDRSFRQGCFANRFNIDFSWDKILNLDSDYGRDDFERIKKMEQNSLSLVYQIVGDYDPGVYDWKLISQYYSGIYYPYQKDFYLLGWDLPSVCLWDLSQIIKVY